MHGVDRAATGVCGDVGEERGLADAEAHLLAFHVAAGLHGRRELIDAKVGQRRIARLFCGGADEQQGHEDDQHCGQEGPALAAIADHASKCVAERRRNQQERQHFEEIRQRRRVLERMRRVRVVVAAAVGAELLDRDLRRGRAERQRLFDDRHFLRHILAGGVLHRIAGGILDRFGLRSRLQQRHVFVGLEILRHPLRNQNQRQDQCERQQHI